MPTKFKRKQIKLHPEVMIKLEEFKNWICTLDKRRVFNLVDFTLSKQGLVKGVEE